MEWNLQVIADANKSPEEIDAMVTNLESYRGKIADMSAEDLLQLIKTYESYYQEMSTLSQYPSLRMAADSNDKEALEMVNKTEDLITNWGKRLAFIEIQVGKLLLVHPEYIDDPALSTYRYFCQRQMESAKHLLTEPEEVLILEKDRNGADEWSKLQGELTSMTKYRIKLKGRYKDYSWSEGYGLITSADHATRKAALQGLGRGLKKNGSIYAFAFRNMASNFLAENKRRGYDNYIQSSLFRSHLNEKIIDSLFEVLLASRDVLKEYLALKAKLMGTEKLRGEDFEAPFPFSTDRKISWNDAKKIVVEGFSEFHPEFGKIAKEMFDLDRVDAKPRSGKRPGAFCSTWEPGKSAFIMTSYNDNMDSLATLSHEMGHAVHAWYITREQPLFHSDMGMSLAETASEFGSLLFALKFMREAQTEDEKKSILFNMVQNFIIVLYEVGSRKLFEQKVYEALDAGSFLDEAKLVSLYREALNDMFGDNVDWLDEQMYHWCWKPHYYGTHLRFYNYPYVFGEFSVLAMYAKYREDPEKFTEGYRSYLKAGGSNLPEDMFRDLFGFELASKEFWQGGISELKSFIQQCKEMVD